MSDKTKEIEELLSAVRQSGADMSSSIKDIGDGDMKNGLKVIADSYEERGNKKGAIIGVIEGSLATLALVGAIVRIKARIDKNKEQKKREEKIVSGLKKGLIEAESGNDNALIDGEVGEYPLSGEEV